MSTALVKREVGDNWDALVEQAETALESGFLPKAIQRPAQAIAIAMAGKELGLAPMASFRLLHVIEGKVALSAEGMLALANQNIAGFGLAVLETTSDRATVEAWRANVAKQKFSFTAADANRAGLMGKDVWRKYPQRMLLWRCIKYAVQTVAPDATLGMHEIDEVHEIVDRERSSPETLAPLEVTIEAPALIEASVRELTDDEVMYIAGLIDAAQTETELKPIGGRLVNETMSEEHRKYLRGCYAKRRNKIAKLAREAHEKAVAEAAREPGADG